MFDDFDSADEQFDPHEWDIRREGQAWVGERFTDRIYRAPEKIEFVGEYSRAKSRD